MTKTFILSIFLSFAFFSGCNKTTPLPSIPNEPMPKGDVVVIGTTDGVYWSADNGDTWKGLNNGIKTGIVSDVFVKDSLMYIKADNDTIYKSTDYGNSWETIVHMIPNESIQVIAVKDSIMYAGGYDGIYLSSDNGVSWHKECNGMNNKYGKGESISSIEFVGNDVIASTHWMVYRSYDRGYTWHLITYGLPRSWISNIYVYKKDVYACTHEGLYYLPNKVYEWQSIGYRDTEVKDFLVSGTDFYIAGDNTLLQSTNNGKYWTSLSPGFSYDWLHWKMAGNEKCIIVCAVANRAECISRSIDNGQSWTDIKAKVPNHHINSLIFMKVK